MNKKQREEMEAEKAKRLEADRLRVESYETIMSSIPWSQGKVNLLRAMEERIWSLFNECRFKEGDAILEFLPRDDAQRLLTEYFDDDDASISQTPNPATSEDENNEPREV